METGQRLMVGIIGGLNCEFAENYVPELRRMTYRNCNVEFMQYDLNLADLQGQKQADWRKYASARLCDAILVLRDVGARRIVIASNTMHWVLDENVGQDLLGQFIHIGDTVAQQCGSEVEDVFAKYHELFKDGEPRRALLLGTLETMGGAFVKGRIERQGFEVVTPDLPTAAMLHEKITQELYHNKRLGQSMRWFLYALKDLLDAQPVHAVVLGSVALAQWYSAELLHQQLEFLGANHGYPFVVVDSRQAHVAEIARVCFREQFRCVEEERPAGEGAAP